MYNAILGSFVTEDIKPAKWICGIWSKRGRYAVLILDGICRHLVGSDPVGRLAWLEIYIEREGESSCF